MRKHRIEIDLNKCIGCNQCSLDCPSNNIAIENKKAVLFTQDCIKCGHCAAVCPKAAITITGYEELPVEIASPTILNPNELLKAIQTRRTIRHFKNQTIKQNILDDIIQVGRWTPTGKNAQDVSYIVLKNDLDRYEKIAVKLFRKLFPFVKLFNPSVRRAKIDDHFFFKGASIAILILSGNEINASLAASNMELMAQAHGLGVLYSGYFSMAVNHSRKLKKALKMKRKDKVVTTLVIGYTNMKYYRTVQKEAANVRYL